MKKIYRILIINNDGYNDDETYIKLTNEEIKIIKAFIKYCGLTQTIIIDTIEDIKIGELFNE